MRQFILTIILTLFTFSANAEWKVFKGGDEFAGTTWTQLIHTAQSPNSDFAFPYKGNKAQLIYACTGNAFGLIFTKYAPNLPGGDISDGYHTHTINAKVDGEFVKFYADQKWGSSVMIFDTSTLRQLEVAKGDILIQLDFYQDGKRHFKFNMDGFDKSNC